MFWGFLIFNETPDVTGILGMVMIVLAGMMTMIEKSPAELLLLRIKRSGSS